jgi:hypothetical protein
MPITHEWREAVDVSHHYWESGIRILEKKLTYKKAGRVSI